VPDRVIVLESRAGLITFRADFELLDHSPSGCALTCNLEFSFSQAIFKIAHAAVEATATARLRSDLEKLRSSLESVDELHK
jgi:hypothetical protein